MRDRGRYDVVPLLVRVRPCLFLFALREHASFLLVRLNLLLVQLLLATGALPAEGMAKRVSVFTKLAETAK
jgi:hypothetical protein